MRNDLSLRLHELTRAVENVLTAGHGQRHWLAEDHPPFDASLADAVRHYGGPCAAFDLWLVCAALDTLERVWKSDEEYTRTKVEP